MTNSKDEFSNIYNQYVDKIYRFIFLKVNSQDITEDLTSETFSRCWKSFNGKSKNIDNIQAFLYKIARNLITDHYRQKGKIQFVSTDDTPILDNRTDIKEKAEDSSDFELVKTALTKINDDYQDIIIWHYLNDLSINEIASMTNKSEGAVRVMLHRALGDLRNNIKEV